MKFKNLGNYYSGHAVSRSVLEQINFSDKENINYETNCRFSIERAYKYDTSQEDKLEVNWLLLIFYKGSEIFRFLTMERLNITEKEIEPTDEELKDAIKLTYSNLKKAFDERRQEFKEFESLINIHYDVIDKLVPLLRHAIHYQQE